MKKFKFRLERVLHYRRLIKDERKRELTRILALFNEATTRLEMLEEAQLANALESERILQVELIVLRGLYAARLKAEIAAQKELIQRLEEEVDKARAAYIEASKELEVLEKLKARQKEEYIHEMDIQEGKVLDEFAVQRRNVETL